MFTKTVFSLLTAALAVQAAPHVKRQGVTELISSGTAPAGCRTVSTSLFGIGIHKATDVPKASTFAKRQVTQAADGQPGAVSSAPAPISVIGDGQPQAPTVTAVPITVIPDGQPQAPTSTMMMMPISQIGDGQAQAYYSQPAVSQIGDGQVQAPVSTAPAVSQLPDAQPQAPTATAPAVTQQTDAQPVAPTATATAVTQQPDAQPGASSTAAAAGASPSVQMVACKTNSTLELTIENGVLYDGLRRQGYIASNYQFQFDAGVPQAGAIITSGFSLCENGTLALGGSTIFWQCLSGSFYNLYDRDWAFQCEPVNLMALSLVDCPAT